MYIWLCYFKYITYYTVLIILFQFHVRLPYTQTTCHPHLSVSLYPWDNHKSIHKSLSSFNALFCMCVHTCYDLIKVTFSWEYTFVLIVLTVCSTDEINFIIGNPLNIYSCYCRDTCYWWYISSLLWTIQSNVCSLDQTTDE